MAASGDWVTPRLNDLKYFEKPPLQYWVTAAAFRAFGVARVDGAAVAGARRLRSRCWSIGFAGVRARRRRRSAPTPRLALGGYVWHVGIAHFLTLDAGLAFLLGVALWRVPDRAAAGGDGRASARVDAGRPGRRWRGATLSKGLIGARAARRRARRSTRCCTRDFGAVAAAAPRPGARRSICALTAPWFVARGAQQRRVPRSSSSSTSTSSASSPTTHRRTGAWWYFVPLLRRRASCPGCWSSCSDAARGWRDGRARTRNGFSWQRFALVWAAFVFVFFSASGLEAAVVHPADVPGAGAASSACVLVAADLRWLARLNAGADAARSRRRGSAARSSTGRCCAASAAKRRSSPACSRTGPWLVGALAIVGRRRHRRAGARSARGGAGAARCWASSRIVARRAALTFQIADRPASTRSARTRSSLRPARRGAQAAHGPLAADAALLPGRACTTRRCRSTSAARRTLVDYPRRAGARASTPSRDKAHRDRRGLARRVGGARRRAMR